MFEGCRVLAMTEAVAREVHRVMQAAYRVEADLLGVREFVPRHRTVEDLRRADSTFLGVFRDGRLAAVVELERPEGEPLNIASLVVMPEYFRRGLGRAHSHGDSREAGQLTNGLGGRTRSAVNTRCCCWLCTGREASLR